MGLLSTKKSLTLAAAKEIGAAAEAEARKNNFTNCVAIFDDGGNLLYLVTMDGTQTGSIKVAQATESTVNVHQTFGHARRCLKLSAMPRPVKSISPSATAEIFQLN